MRNFLLTAATLLCFSMPSLAQAASADAPKDPVAIANAAADAIQAVDLPRFLSLLTDDAVIWHNYDRKDNVARTFFPGYFAQLTKRGGVHKYIDRKYQALPDGGVVIQHISTYSVGAHGEPATSHPTIQHMYIRDGKISRIEEYFDRSQSGSTTSGSK